MSAIGNLYGYGYTQTSDPYASSYTQSTSPLAAYTTQTNLNDALSTLNELEGPNPTLGGVDVNSLLSGTGMNVSQLLNQGMDSSNYTTLIGLDSMMNPESLGVTNSTLATAGLGTSGTSMTPQDMMGTCMEMMSMMLQMMTGQGSGSTMDALSSAFGSSGSTSTSTSSSITSNPLTSPIYSYYNQYDPTTDSP